MRRRFWITKFHILTYETIWLPFWRKLMHHRIYFIGIIQLFYLTNGIILQYNSWKCNKNSHWVELHHKLTWINCWWKIPRKKNLNANNSTRGLFYNTVHRYSEKLPQNPCTRAFSPLIIFNNVSNLGIFFFRKDLKESSSLEPSEEQSEVWNVESKNCMSWKDVLENTDFRNKF